MQYEKAEAFMVEFESEDIITASGEECGTTQALEEQQKYDAEHCDGQTQAVTKPF